MFDVIKSSATLVNPQFNTAFNQLLTDALQLILIGLASLVSFAVREWMKSQNSGWKKMIAERLVKYAEQKITDNTDKQKWVADKMSEHFPRMKSEEIQHHIEEAVVNLKAQIDAPATTTNVAVVEPTPPALPPITSPTLAGGTQ
jgi:hypothetical protein